MIHLYLVQPPAPLQVAVLYYCVYLIVLDFIELGDPYAWEDFDMTSEQLERERALSRARQEAKRAAEPETRARPRRGLRRELGPLGRKERELHADDYAPPDDAW